MATKKLQSRSFFFFEDELSLEARMLGAAIRQLIDEGGDVSEVMDASVELFNEILAKVPKQ